MAKVFFFFGGLNNVYIYVYILSIYIYIILNIYIIEQKKTGNFLT